MLTTAHWQQRPTQYTSLRFFFYDKKYKSIELRSCLCKQIVTAKANSLSKILTTHTNLFMIFHYLLTEYKSCYVRNTDTISFPHMCHTHVVLNVALGAENVLGFLASMTGIFSEISIFMHQRLYLATSNCKE